jgi:ABC-type multidrug transport system fused ATPase/permease subunit
VLRRFFAYYRPYRRLFWLDFSSAVASGLLELAFPLAVTLFVDRLLPSGNLGAIVAAALGLLAVYLTNTGLISIVTYWGHMLGINIETDMRRRRSTTCRSSRSATSTTRRPATSSAASPRTSRRSARSPTTGPRTPSSR